MARPEVDPQVGLRASTAAASLRGDRLLRLRLSCRGELAGSEAITWRDLVSEARTDHGQPLRRIRLTSVMDAMGIGASVRTRRIAALRRRVRVASTTSDKSLTIGWLLRPNASTDGRLAAFADAVEGSNAERLGVLGAGAVHRPPTDVVEVLS